MPMKRSRVRTRQAMIEREVAKPPAPRTTSDGTPSSCQRSRRAGRRWRGNDVDARPPGRARGALPPAPSQIRARFATPGSRGTCAGLRRSRSQITAIPKKMARRARSAPGRRARGSPCSRGSPVGIARAWASTSPKTSSQSSGWTARVSSSVGSWRACATRPARPSRRPGGSRTAAGGSAQAAGRAARSSDVTIGTSSPLLVERRAGEVREHVVQAGAGADLGGERLGGTQGDELAEMHDPDALAQLGRLVHVMRGEQDRGALARPGASGRAPTRRVGRSDPAQPWARRGRARAAGGASPGRSPGGDHPAREGANQLVGDLREAHEPSASSIRSRRSDRGMWYRRPEMSRFSRAVSAPSDREQLRHVADRAPHQTRLADDVVTRDGCVAGGRRQQRDQHLDRGRLAGAVRARAARRPRPA